MVYGHNRESTMQSVGSVSNFRSVSLHLSSSGSSLSDVESESLPKSEESEDAVFPDGESSSMMPLSDTTNNSFDSAIYPDSSSFCWKPSLTTNPSNIPVTPSGSAGNTDACPWTPTANLKLLLKAVSPEIRFKDQQEAVKNSRKTLTERLQQRNERIAEESGLEQWEDSVEKNEQMISRKDKSLGLLCQRFLLKYPSMPPLGSKIEISLDEAAEFLGVGRRRVYDIINVLEATELASRLAKNKYLWHGKTNLKETLQKLKAAALHEGLDKQIENLKLLEFNHETDGIKFPKSKSMPEPDEASAELDSSPCPDGPKKSLNSLSQKFLMMFLVAQPQILNLDLCARVLIGDAAVDHSDLGKFKTTIRRLYDIANIMASLDLIEKVQITETRGRKPAFRYIGPKVDDVNGISHDGVLFTKPGRKTANAKRSFAKHLSFEHICEAAEFARNGISSKQDAFRFQKSTSKTNSNQFNNFTDSNRETEEGRTANSSSLKKSNRLMSHATLCITKSVDVPEPDEKAKPPVVLMIPDSKSHIRIFRTRSDSAIGQPSSVSSKLVRSRMEEIAEENCNVNHVSKKRRYEVNLKTDCPDKGGEHKPGQQVAYLKLTLPLVLHQNSFMQTSLAPLNSEIAESSVEATSQDLTQGSESDSRESFNSAFEIGGRTSASVSQAVSAETNYLSGLTNVLSRGKKFLPALGKENAVQPNSDCNVKSGDQGVEMQKKLSGLFKPPNITLRRISSFDSAPQFYFGMPLSSNMANISLPLGLHSSSNIDMTSRPFSSGHNLATTQPPLVSSATTMHNVGVKPPRTDGLAKLSPSAPRVIFLRKLPSAGTVQPSNQFFGLPSFMTGLPQQFSSPMQSGNLISSEISSSSGHSFKTAMDL